MPPAIEHHVAQTAAPSPAFNGDWAALVAQLKLGGQARMLAVQCELQQFDNDLMQLRVPVEHKHLTDKSYQDKLRESLSAHFGRPVRLAISLTDEIANTPIKQLNDARAARQAEAETIIQDDPFVRDAISQLDARIVTIQPVDQPAT